MNMTDSAAADIARAEGLVEQALAASPRSPLAHFAKGQVLRAQGRYEEAIPEYETAIALNRNWVGALRPSRPVQILTGSIEEAIPLVEQAIRLSPRDPYIGHLVLPDRACASAAIAHRRGDRLARKGAQRQSGTPARSRAPRLRLCPQRRDRTRRRRTRRSPQAESATIVIRASPA